MESFIGRRSELAVLEKQYERKSGFVVLYGRRRVGKTTLIKELSRANPPSTSSRPARRRR